MITDPDDAFEWRTVPASEIIDPDKQPPKNPQPIRQRIGNVERRVAMLRRQLRDHVEAIIEGGNKLDLVATAISEDLTTKIEAQERHLANLRKVEQMRRRAERAALPW